MLSAVVYSKSENMAGPGFFTLAKELGKFSGNMADHEEFWVRELNNVYQYWGEHGPTEE